ncbi:MAG: hypothetical protein M3437_01150 [Chloroflexota bacterium]|nr:hypothetical protein [Chloroflexota bacterium]MDQ5864287.1 hypothetical protein [Chloroflexota bacterium]
MNTPTPPIEGTNLFRSPLRITADAVELRDIAYPMSSIKAAEVLPVVTNRGGWGFGIFVFDMFGSFQVGNVAVELRVWEGRPAAQEWVLLFTAASAYLLVAYLLRWLYKRSQRNWQYIYAASLDTNYGMTMVAASHDGTYIARIVADINAALAAHKEVVKPPARKEDGWKTFDSGPTRQDHKSTHAPILYDNYFRISDSYVEVPDWSAPLADVRYAAKSKLEGWPSFSGIDPRRPLVFLTMGVTLKIGFELWRDVTMIAVAILVAMLILLALWGRRKSKDEKELPTMDYVYIALLSVAGKDVPAIISTDRGFVDKLVSSINEIVQERRTPTRRPTSTRPTT